MFCEALVGEADGEQAGGGGDAVAFAVSLERVSGLVVFPAVELDDDFVLWEVGVDSQAAEVDVGVRGG